MAEGKLFFHNKQAIIQSFAMYLTEHEFYTLQIWRMQYIFEVFSFAFQYHC